MRRPERPRLPRTPGPGAELPGWTMELGVAAPHLGWNIWAGQSLLWGQAGHPQAGGPGQCLLACSTVHRPGAQPRVVPPPPRKRPQNLGVRPPPPRPRPLTPFQSSPQTDPPRAAPWPGPGLDCTPGGGWGLPEQCPWAGTGLPGTGCFARGVGGTGALPRGGTWPLLRAALCRAEAGPGPPVTPDVGPGARCQWPGCDPPSPAVGCSRVWALLLASSPGSRGLRRSCKRRGRG